MRTTLRDLPGVIRQDGWVDAIGEWWADLPKRWQCGWWWKSLFFEPGQGLLRWSLDGREEWRGWDAPPDPYPVAPPVRRLWMVLRHRALWPLDMVDKEWLR